MVSGYPEDDAGFCDACAKVRKTVMVSPGDIFKQVYLCRTCARNLMKTLAWFFDCKLVKSTKS